MSTTAPIFMLPLLRLVLLLLLLISATTVDIYFLINTPNVKCFHPSTHPPINSSMYPSQVSLIDSLSFPVHNVVSAGRLPRLRSAHAPFTSWATQRPFSTHGGSLRFIHSLFYLLFLSSLCRWSLLSSSVVIHLLIKSKNGPTCHYLAEIAQLGER